MISDPKFRAVIGHRSLSGIVKLSDNWTLNLKSSGSDARGEADPAHGGGVRIAWDGTPKLVRLSQDLRIEPTIAAVDADYKVVVRIEAQEADPKLVDWIGFLTKAGDVVHKMALKVFRGKGGHWTIVGRSTGHRLSEDAALLCIQLDKQPKQIILRSVRGKIQRSSPAERQQITAAPAKPVNSSSGRRPRAVVIAWDMTHNAAGRAHLLAEMLSRDYEVLVVGPLFARYGGAVWAPLRSSGIEHRTFAANSLGDFARSAAEFVDGLEAEVVVACKPRIPSILLALLMKHRLGCPILIDVDDHELSFFAGAAPIPLDQARSAFAADGDSTEPQGAVWTRVAESLIASFDALIVSNVALQRRFGGTIIRHARDEHLFGPDPNERASIRVEFGYSVEDRVVLFLGTPRAHKGIFRIADALRRLRIDDLVLCVIGTVTAKSVARQLSLYEDVRIDLFPDQPWERLAKLIRMADCVCLLQDEADPVAQYQMPAKLTDALATGVPVAVTKVPPFADIPPGTVTVVRTAEDLDRFLASVAAGDGLEGFRACGRDYFLGELSFGTNRARLNAVIADARGKAAVWRNEWSEVLKLVSELGGAPLPVDPPLWAIEIEYEGTTRVSE